MTRARRGRLECHRSSSLLSVTWKLILMVRTVIQIADDVQGNVRNQDISG